MTTTLLDRLTAAIDEDERIALEAQREQATPTERRTQYPFPERVATAVHFGRHSPRAVLIRCAAERKLLAAVLQWEHEYNDDNPYTSCAQAIAHGDPDAQTPGDGCADEGRAGGPCDCATGRRRDLILSSLAAAYDLTVEED